jgi:hypothetical protein
MFSDKTAHNSASGIDSAPIQHSHHGPGIRETVKRPKQTGIKESQAGSALEFLFGTCDVANSCCSDQSHGEVISIHSILDSVLLEIFALSLDDDCDSSDDEDTAPLSEWQLAHVCQRWRCLIFGSASRFDLELVCSPGIPVRETLGSFPALPIVIEYRGEVASKDTDNVIAALEHPDRVRRITLSGLTRALWEKLDAAIQEPFPALTRLSLTGPRDQDERSGWRCPAFTGTLLTRHVLSGITAVPLVGP